LSSWGVLKAANGVLRGMSGSFSLAGLRSLGLEVEAEAPAAEGRLGTPPAADAEPSPGPPVLFLPDTGNGAAEAGLMGELCLLSGATGQKKHTIINQGEASQRFDPARLQNINGAVIRLRGVGLSGSSEQVTRDNK